MDPVTHFTTGALAGRSLAGRFGAWRMFVFCAAASWLPDVDNLFPLGVEGYLRHHRAFTHSVFGLPLLALALAGIFRIFWRDIPFRWLFWTGLAVMALQVYLDLATTFGTMVLWPLTDHRFAFPGVFIIDVFFTLVLLGLLVLSLVKKKLRTLLGVLGLLFAVLYPLANWSVSGVVDTALERRFQIQDPGLRSVEVTTDLLTPLYWKVVLDDGDNLWIGGVGPLPLLDLTRLESFPKADQALLDRLGDQASIFATWEWFARYPVVLEDVSTPKGRRVTFMDLRFYSLSPLGRKLFTDYEPPFTLTALLDSNGTMTGWIYERRDVRQIDRIPD